MTPINSPSVGPVQPSALKVKGRGTSSGWLFPGITAQACLCGLCTSPCTHSPCSVFLIKSMFTLHWYMPYVCTCALCVCVPCVYRCLCVKYKSCIYVPSSICVSYLCMKRIHIIMLLCYVCTQCRAYICVHCVCANIMCMNPISVNIRR